MDQQFSLSWNNFHGNLTKGFEGLLGNGEFVDVTIAVEGHLLQAHKVILSICSPYFKKMFQLNPCQHPIVVLRDVSHKAMKDLLQFMYHGEVSVKREDLTSFIGTAEVLQIKGLTNKETDDVSEKVLPKHSDDHIHNPVEVETSLTDTFDNSLEDNTQNESILTKQRHFIEKLHRLNNMKRKSEEFLQKNYYSELLADKRPKIKDKPYTTLNNHSKSNYEMKNVYDDTPLDVSKGNTQKATMNKEINEKSQDQSTLDNSIELKTECDDMDIIVTDPAVCTTPKSYDSSRDGKRDGVMDFDSPQDNCTSLNSLFMDLKNLVNGKVTKSLRGNGSEDIQRNPLIHSLVTIPQKEDGKKKYPQRSCRLCWKMGRRRDTRFMCSACELPFCKTPCFDVHYNEILKSQIQVDYYAT